MYKILTFDIWQKKFKNKFAHHNDFDFIQIKITYN